MTADEEGSGSVLVLAVFAVAFTVLTLLGALAQTGLARRQAETAADLTALAAAEAVLAGTASSGACEPSALRVAAQVAEANQARLNTCSAAADGSVTVSVDVRLTGQLARFGVLRAEARAGPSP